MVYPAAIDIERVFIDLPNAFEMAASLLPMAALLDGQNSSCLTLTSECSAS
jgi:hypothetical protein